MLGDQLPFTSFERYISACGQRVTAIKVFSQPEIVSLDRLPSQAYLSILYSYKDVYMRLAFVSLFALLIGCNASEEAPEAAEEAPAAEEAAEDAKVEEEAPEAPAEVKEGKAKAEKSPKKAEEAK